MAQTWLRPASDRNLAMKRLIPPPQIPRKEPEAEARSRPKSHRYQKRHPFH